MARSEDFGPGRDRVVIATKVFNAMGDDPNQRGLSRKHIMHAIDDSLRRLGMDYVDLYQIHRFDHQTPIEETLEALTDVVQAGKALYIGGSSMFAWQFAKMLYTSDERGLARFVTMQNHYNLDVSRRGARDDAAVPRRRDRPHSVESAGPRVSGGKSTKKDFGETSRAKTDDFAHRMYYDDSDFEVVDRVSAGRKAPRSFQCAGGTCLASGPARRCRADHRREQDEPPRRCSRSRKSQT